MDFISILEIANGRAWMGDITGNHTVQTFAFTLNNFGMEVFEKTTVSSNVHSVWTYLFYLLVTVCVLNLVLGEPFIASLQKSIEVSESVNSLFSMTHEMNHFTHEDTLKESPKTVNMM